jgi:hypothetical protein
MPLGDSITNAETGHASYRYWLWHNLVDNGYTNVDFVGSQTGVLNGPPLYPDFDQNHEGHWGWRADEILGQIGGWANTYRPDIVLMHLGTNDMFQGQTVSSTINELGSIIDSVRQSSPNVTFLFAQVIPSVNNAQQLQQLNNAIPGLAAQKNTQQSRVIVVDQWTGYNGSTDNYDGIHPNQSGEQKMANKWYATLQTLLTQNAPPVTTYLSNLNPTFATNGWGPYEKDKSNGEANAGDGHTITLNGATYTKGLGTHANSELRYSLGGQYTNFQADIGVDDEVGNAGSVVFQVWDNLGNKLYDSGTMTGSTATKTINVNVTGKSEIRLIVTNADGNFDSDHGDWASARITKPATNAPTVNPFNGATINEAGTYTASGSFSDSGSGPWTATVNYGDGGGDVALALNPDETFNLSHVYADNGGYTVTVKVNNGQAIGTNTATVNVNNVTPVVSAGGDGSVTAGTLFTRSGSFTDPGTQDTWTGTVDYGDGAGPIALSLNPNKTFSLSKTYTVNGTYTVVVAVKDKDNATGTATFRVTVTGGTQQQTTYLSDLTPTGTPINGWGPYEKDHSNGEANPNDGGPIRIAGVTYTKGLGVHAYSELHYNLNRAQDRFQANVGVDDETGGGGSVRFLVYGDNVLLYDSGVMRGGQAAKAIDVAVVNVADLKLVANDSGDNVFDDHGDWGNARVVKQQTGLVVNPIAGATINEGGSYSANGSYSDPGTGPWTATVNYGDGSGNLPLTLNADKTFALSHTYADNGTYNVVVTVNNGTAQASANASVLTNNVAPTVALGPDMNSNTHFLFSGAFADPGADTWSGTVDYGDGTGSHALTLNSVNKTFNLDNVYVYNGIYTVKVTVLDDDGGSNFATMRVTVSGGIDQVEKYLSSMSTTGTPVNGWGPYEKDMSNGEILAGDGHPIKIAGATYTKGLGTHANSDLSFSLAGGNYTHFITDYGVDDEEGGAGSVHFVVYLDGVLAFDSGTVRGGQAARHLDLNVAGKSTLRLVVTDNGDGKDSDHADWAGAKLT